MKETPRFARVVSIIVVLAILASLCLVVNVAPVSAQPAITVAPTSGGPGTTVTVTTTTPCPTGGVAYAIDFTDSGATTTQNLATGTLASTGRLPGAGNTDTIVIPATAAGGAGTVTLVGAGVDAILRTADDDTATAAFTVSGPPGTLTLSPGSGPIGAQVTVSGSNMTPDGVVPVGSLTFAGMAWNTWPISMDSMGKLMPTTLTVPVSSGTGPQTVSGTDSGGVSATGTFTVTQPTITISPTSGYRGGTVTVTGSRWIPGPLGSVAITFAGSAILVATPDANGDFAAQFVVPVTAGASNLVSAMDTPGRAAPAQTFMLLPPELTVDPTEGPAGTSATVAGVGFMPQTVLTSLTIGGASILPYLSPVTTDAEGSFTVTFTVPALAARGWIVAATVPATTLSTFFTVTATEAPPTVAGQLASISDVLIRVWRYYAGEWLMYDPADVPGSDFQSLVGGEGYWFKVGEDCKLIHGGDSLDLTAGWNLIGWR